MPLAPALASAAPPVLLAPMAGLSDLPFRRLVARHGAALVVSEMVASHDVLNVRPDARARTALGLDAADTAVQLAGCDPGAMARAARLVEAAGARQIDINMGCPAKRVTAAGGTGAAGSALMRDPDHALRLIEAVIGAAEVPVTLKTRLGWDDHSRNAPDIARRAEAAGVALITVHGRTRCQFYKGRADWDAIAPVVASVGIPVIANGDIATPADARRALARSGARGVMLGRAVPGRPWLLAQIAADLAGQPEPAPPRGTALADLVAEHYQDMLAFHGRDIGLRAARKHLGAYMDHAGTGAGLRRRVLTAAAPAEVLRLLPEALADTQGAARLDAVA